MVRVGSCYFGSLPIKEVIVVLQSTRDPVVVLSLERLCDGSESSRLSET